MAVRDVLTDKIALDMKALEILPTVLTKKMADRYCYFCQWTPVRHAAD
jgi:hypothetical protein